MNDEILARDYGCEDCDFTQNLVQYLKKLKEAYEKSTVKEETSEMCVDEEEYWDIVLRKECLSVLKHLNHTRIKVVLLILFADMLVGERGDASG